MRKPGKIVPVFCAFLRAAVWFSAVAAISGTGGARPGTLDPSFNAGLVQAPVYEVAFHLDGVLLIGGSSFSRLKADGRLDTAFAPVINGPVFWFTVQPDGRVLIAGYFTTAGGLPRNRLARLLADGSVDTEFDPGKGPYDGTVQSVKLLPDGRIVVGGDFTYYNYKTGILPRPGVAWLLSDGQMDPNVVPPPDVRGLLDVQSDGKVLKTFYAGSGPGIVRLTLDGALDT